MIPELALLLVLIALSFFFSLSETAIVACSRFKIKYFVQQHRPGSKTLEKLKDNLHRTVSALLIANNVVNLAAAAYVTTLTLKQFGDAYVAIATGILTFVLVLIAEVVPKSVAIAYPGTIALTVAPIVYVLRLALSPIVFVFDFIVQNVFRFKPVPPQITEEEVRSIIDLAKEEGGIDVEEKEMIHRIFKFDDTEVDDIKVPRMDMVTLDSRKKLRDALDLVKKKGHARIPISGGSKDKIVGIFYYKDAAEQVRLLDLDVPITKLMRPAIFVPETKKLNEMLKLFQKQKQHMAIIVDEHGGVSGVVTLEDCVEELVGDISDESEPVEPLIVRRSQRSWRILGKAPIGEVNRRLRIQLPVEKGYDTLSGFLLHSLGAIPQQDSEVDLNGVKFKIGKVEGNRILEVAVRK
ncbi:HlyC/CorC family transporter [Candidatus Woesearchaeota archaeon]|nr:HlyC/CorC family transporter [Candidatus Woesearchaeota archaeon]